ncbi:MAG TPA: deaminase, partial [Solirubrobacteraceae bacterium]|nr:deaminase [Solirubrobacteraceae bacterium]
RGAAAEGGHRPRAPLPGAGVSRATWDETWMAVADAVARRSACVRAQVGAVIVDRHNRIIATGYNGAPAGYVMAQAHGSCRSYCPRALVENGDVDAGYTDCVSIHAEANALAFCDRRDREGGVMYVTTSVCYGCAKLVANSGLVRVVLRVPPLEHRDPGKSIRMLTDSGVLVDVVGSETEVAV